MAIHKFIRLIENNERIPLYGNGKTKRDYTYKKASVEFLPMQPGDVNKTAANISKAKKFLKYKPKVSFETGIRNFVEWKKKIDSINLELRQ